MNIRLKGMIRKEFYHIFRDKQTLLIILSLPVLMMLLYGYAISLDLRDVETRIIDFDQTQVSRDFANRFTSSHFFKTKESATKDFRVIHTMMREENVKLVIVIPKGFNKDLQTANNPKVKTYIDASDPNTANLVRFYVDAFAMLFSISAIESPVIGEPRFLYNQNLSPPYFFVPGLVAFIMIMLSALLTAITVSRELESGTMEQLLVSPLKPTEIILGKTLPYLLVAFTAELFILVFGKILFDLPFRGSFILLLILSLFFLTASLAIGLVASTTSKNQQEAMFKSLLITLLPTLFLSGFIFPLESMLPVFQWAANIIPAKYFITIIRGILLKDNSLLTLIAPISGLAIIMVVLLRASIAKFSIYLEH